MTRTGKVLTALAGLAGLCYSQQVQVTVSVDGDGKNLEYNKEQTFTCKWTPNDLLIASDANLDLTKEPLQIKWYYNGSTIFTMQADDYTAYPNFGTIFSDRESVVASASVNVTESTLKLSNVELKDVGDYKCRVSLRDPKNINGKMGYVSGYSEMAGVKVYAKPNVTFTDVTAEFDQRPTEYAAWVAANQPVEQATNITETIDGPVDSEINSENSIPEVDAESASGDSRKKRQADEEIASPEIQNVAIQPEPIATCVVKGAFPEPASVKVSIGESLIASEDSSSLQISNSGELYDTDVKVSAAFNGAEQNGKTIKCAVSDADSMYNVEAESEVLNIKCKYDTSHFKHFIIRLLTLLSRIFSI